MHTNNVSQMKLTTRNCFRHAVWVVAKQRKPGVGGFCCKPAVSAIFHFQVLFDS